MSDNKDVTCLRPLLVALGCAVLAAVSTPAVAQDAGPGRVLHRFDFEERDDGNFEDLPMHWSRVVGPGMPHYVKGVLATDAAKTGEYSFRLDLNGGSALYRLSPDFLPARPSARYRIQGQVRTSDLTFARARFTAYCVDDMGQVLPGTIRHSKPAMTRGQWQTLSVETGSDDPRTAFVVVELGLLQPVALGEDAAKNTGDATADDLARFRQDVNGTAWFDDVIVSHVPVLKVGTAAAGQVFAAGEPVRLYAEALDPKPQGMTGRVIVRDAEGQTVLDTPGERFAEPSDEPGDPVRFRFESEALPAGWYEASIVIAGNAARPVEDSVEATTQRLAFVVLGDAQAAPPADDRVSLDATHLTVDQWPALPELLPTLAAGRVKLAVWSQTNDASTTETGEQRPLDLIAGDLGRRDIAITGVFAGPSPEIEEAAGALGVSTGVIGQYQGWPTLVPTLAKIAKDQPITAENEQDFAELWRTGVSFLVSRHARQIKRWQVGTDVDADAFAQDASMRRVYHAFRGAAGELLTDPDLAMPWPVRMGLTRPQEMAAGDPWASGGGQAGVDATSERLPRTLSLRVPADVSPNQIPLYVDEILKNPLAAERDLSLSLGLLDGYLYGVDRQQSDLAKRVTWTLASGVDRVTLPMPFEPVASPMPGGGSKTQQPTQSYLTMRTLMQQLAGKRFRGRLPAPEGVRAFLFAPDNSIYAAGRGNSLQTGVVVVWCENDNSEVELPVTFAGDQPGDGGAMLTLAGNRSPIAQTDAERIRGMIRVPVGNTPVLITGVETGLTRLRQLVRLDDAFLESRFEPQTRTLIFENPYDRPIAGRLAIRPPEGWTMALDGESAFVLQPGERLERPVEISFPYNSFSGRQVAQVDLRLAVGGTADREQGGRLMRVPLALELGLADIGMQSLAWRDGRDVVVQQTISNYGGSPVSFSSYVMLQGFPRQDRLVTDLPPGGQATRLFRIENAAVRTRQAANIRSGLRELEGQRILNQSIELAAE